jgi:hypothetical protein
MERAEADALEHESTAADEIQDVAEQDAKTAPVRGDEEFTSEIYKLELKNLNKFTSVSELKKVIGKFGVTPVKVKKNPKWNYAYVTFAVCVLCPANYDMSDCRRRHKPKSQPICEHSFLVSTTEWG